MRYDKTKFMRGKVRSLSAEFCEAVECIYALLFGTLIGVEGIYIFMARFGVCDERFLEKGREFVRIVSRSAGLFHKASGCLHCGLFLRCL